MMPMSRRKLLTSGLAGLAFAGLPSLHAHAQRKGGKKTDPVIDYLVEGMIANHNAMKKDGLRARHIYRHADAIRAFTVYSANNTEIDDLTKTSVAANARKHGRDGFAALARHAHEQCLDCRSDLSVKGFDIADLGGTVKVTPVVQQRGLDILQYDGLTPILEREAHVLERRAKVIERTFGAGLFDVNAGLIVNAYDTCDDFWDDGCYDGGGTSGVNCSSWHALVAAKDVLTAYICFDPLTVEVCPIMILNLAIIKLEAWWAGC